MIDLVSRPSVLQAVETPRAWGWELWLTSGRTEGAAVLPDAQSTLAVLVREHPEVLGHWARRLFGDEMPIFAKLIRTNFPSRVHIGFRRTVERGELLHRLEREQDLMRSLLGALRAPNAPAFEAYQARYSAWATEQALAGWQRDDDATTTSAFAPFVEPSFALAAWVSAVRANRAAIVDALNDVDLREERGNLLLSSAGIVHAIFGLSHQTHPLDGARATLEDLFTRLAARVARGADDDELARVIDEASLSRLRAGHREPPKNEAWFPTVVDGDDVLAEPQQSSDTTYSLADFYTPLRWGVDRVRFRKGDAGWGITRDELRTYLADVDFRATSLASIRCAPSEVPRRIARRGDALSDRGRRRALAVLHRLPARAHGERRLATAAGRLSAGRRDARAGRARARVVRGGGALGACAWVRPGDARGLVHAHRARAGHRPLVRGPGRARRSAADRIETGGRSERAADPRRRPTREDRDARLEGRFPVPNSGRDGLLREEGIVDRRRGDDSDAEPGRAVEERIDVRSPVVAVRALHHHGLRSHSRSLPWRRGVSTAATPSAASALSGLPCGEVNDRGRQDVPAERDLGQGRGPVRVVADRRRAERGGGEDVREQRLPPVPLAARHFLAPDRIGRQRGGDERSVRERDAGDQRAGETGNEAGKEKGQCTRHAERAQ